MDLNTLRDAVNASGEGNKLEGGTLKLQPKSETYQRYLDFKFATPKVREAIAKENEVTPERYEASLLMLAKFRKEVPDRLGVGLKNTKSRAKRGSLYSVVQRL